MSNAPDRFDGEHPHHASVPENGPVIVTTNLLNNVLEKFESFLLLPGEKKVSIDTDTRVPNCNIFHFKKEDHTIGNTIKDALMRNSHVQFAGYIVPHPLFPDFDLRVQTDGTLTPREAVAAACRESVRMLEVVKQQFIREWELKKISREGPDSRMGGLGDHSNAY